MLSIIPNFGINQRYIYQKNCTQYILSTEWECPWNLYESFSLRTFWKLFFRHRKSCWCRWQIVYSIFELYRVTYVFFFSLSHLFIAIFFSHFIRMRQRTKQSLIPDSSVNLLIFTFHLKCWIQLVVSVAEQ